MKGFSTVLLLLLLPAATFGIDVDPTLDPIKTLTCTMPSEREDGTPLAVDEIAEIRFFVASDQDGFATWTPAGTNTSCSQVYDLSRVADGAYRYTGTAVDTDGRESIKSPDLAEITVKRVALPAHPTNFGF